MSAHPFLEPSPWAVDEGHLIGRHPCEITEDEWLEHTPVPDVGLRAIRAKCLDCAHTPQDVRKCVQVSCPLWPLRMGLQPRSLAKVRKRLSDRPAGRDASAEATGGLESCPAGILDATPTAHSDLEHGNEH